MTKIPSSPTHIDPLADSEEQERATLAALRLRAGETGTEGPVKPLIENQKSAKTTSSYQSYLFGNAGSSGVPAWSDSAHGRAAIRVISRGIMGSLGFVIGERVSSRQMEHYLPETWAFQWNKPLQTMAKGIDTMLGAPLKASIKQVAITGGHAADAEKIAERALTFRESKPHNKIPQRLGYSYGADVVNFTTNFAFASTFDATTRNIIQAIDPNVKKSWLLNDKGEAAGRGETKHFDSTKWLKSTARTAGRIIFKNQGEDWAAAIPYAFQMKYQRQFLTNVFGRQFEGHSLVFDRGWNGGAYKVRANPNGRYTINGKQHEIVGDYQAPAIFDTAARFVGYNNYTLIYRESFDYGIRAYEHWKDNHYRIRLTLPEHFNPVTAAVDGVGSAVRYIAKSMIKADLYMIPSVIPFCLVRIPQSKWRSGTVEVDAAKRVVFNRRGQANVGETPVNDFHNPAIYDGYETKTTLDRFEKRFSQVLNPIGWFTHKSGTAATNLGNKIADKGLMPQRWSDSAARERFLRDYVDTAYSYTPYMWFKAEAGLRVDDNQGDGKPGNMDKAIYGLLDNIASFNGRGVVKSMKRIWDLGIHFEHEVSGREGDDDGKQGDAAKAPVTTVYASTLQHGPAALERAEAPARSDAAPDGRWAKMVMNGDYNAARLHPGSQTRH